MKRFADKDALERSTDMAPVEGAVEVDVPIGVLWEAFFHSKSWPRWNRCFFWVHSKRLEAGKNLVWFFQPIRWWYFYKMFAIATVVEVERVRKVTWEVTALPGFYARHTYYMEDLGGGRSRFGSWEQAMGVLLRFHPTRCFWISHFTFVRDRSLEGVKTLADIYRRDRRIAADALPARHHRAFWASLCGAVILLIAAALGAWFYRTYVRLTVIEVVPGVTAILAGGGNSLLVEDSGRALLVDTKFPPGSVMLRRLIRRKTHTAVTLIVNTHYHYDHTYGNVEFPLARIYAYRNVPVLMRLHDGDWWSKHRDSMPTVLVGEESELSAGSQQVMLVHPGTAHTAGDLYLVLHRNGKDIVATGDLVFNTYYPMMDLGEGGMSLDGLRTAVATLAARYPEAIFVPGHGPLASSRDLLHYAAYLQRLSDTVADARRNGLSEDQAVESLDLSSSQLHRLPSLHDGQLCVSSATANIRWVYQLEAGIRVAGEDCNF
jgi:glyoxylase-like metal-dependent hydrolase (beta-lactamase superfamily II)